MDSPDLQPTADPIDWESFYRDYRKPGYVPGYEIRTQLGSGAFGLVFKANKESINKPYAIKFLKIDSVEVREAVVRELDTVRLFAQVDHPNLVSIEDMGEVDGIPYIVMAFAGEQTLRQLIDSGELTRGRALNLFGQICRGVQALHDHSLVHFDIKPANVYLKGDVARVGDYGLSKLVTDSRNSLSMGRGTPYYMAPELLRRKGDARSDIYALGVMLYELLCGQPPFRGDSEWEVLRKHEEQAPEFPAEIGEPERAVIARALAKDPAARFQSVRELMSALLGGAVPPPPVPPPPARPDPAPARRHHRRRARPAMVTLLAGLVAAGLLGLLTWSTVPLRPEPIPINTYPRSADAPATPRPAAATAAIPGSAPHELLAVAENMQAGIRRQLLTLSRRLPSDTESARYYASLIVSNAGAFLPELLAELERLGRSVEEAATWHELIRQAAAEQGRGTTGR